MAETKTSVMSSKHAREVLGVTAQATSAELRRAFREAAKLAHPDRVGGDANRFRAVVEAYHLLHDARPADRFTQPPATVARAPRPAQGRSLPVSPLLAMTGGAMEHIVADGRRIRLTLPPGLRAGDKVRAGEAEFEVTVRGDGEMLVRGDDVWITVPLDPRLLVEGGRVALETPLGRRVVWITKKAGERGLLRLVGQGLPARGRHRQGHLFLRLTAQPSQANSAARTLRRRFAAAWAA